MSFERSEQVTIANLPVNPYENEDQSVNDSGNNQPTEENIINMTDYNPDKSFVLFGESTRVHKEYIKNTLGGKFIPKLHGKPGFPGGPGWIFPISKKEEVSNFVNQVNSGSISTQQNIPMQGSPQGLPTVMMPSANNKYQTVRWKVFKPTTGMTVTIKANGTKTEGEVLQVDSNRGFVDTAYISVNGATSKLVICNGKWMVWGYMVDHTVFFNDTS